MCDAICADFFARTIKCLLAFADAKYFCVQRFAFSFVPHSFKQCASIWNQRHTAQSPILCAGGCVPAHNNFARVKINIPPSDLFRLTNAASRECQAGARNRHN